MFLLLGFNVVRSQPTNPDGTHTYFVATNGNDANGGTLSAPFATLMHAESVVVPGDTVYIRGGNYVIPANQIPATTDNSDLYYDYNYFSKKGTASKRICYWGYKNERPVFDFTNVKPAGHRITAFYVTGSYYYFKNFEIIGVQVTITTHTQSECFRNYGGNNNIFENLSMHDNQAIGFYLTKGANNLVYNCDAYNNCDSTSEAGAGGNVDGFGCHPNSTGSTGNVFRGCRAWLNSDDGFDLINAFAAVTFDSCFAFYNGYSKNNDGTLVSRGDGNGFKAGGFGMGTITKYPDPIPRHTVERSLAYYNKQCGFYANHHLGGINFYNNTAYQNGKNFNMVNRKSVAEAVDIAGYGHHVQNNISYLPRSSGADILNIDESSDSASLNTNNSFSVPISAGDNDFNSLDINELTLPRKADGSLPDMDLFTLKSDRFVDKGIDVGLPYYGTAPDLGYRETDRTVLPTANLDGTHTYFVATNGNDANVGTISSPFATLMHAESLVAPGDTVYIRGGNYVMPSDMLPATTDGSGSLYYDYNYFGQKATAGKRIYYWGYQNERPVFDFSNVKPVGHRITAFYVTGNYYYFKNFEVIGVQVTITDHTQSECFRNASANHNTYENLAMHDGQAIGFYLSQGIGNYIYNCDAYNNLDYTSNDGTAGGNVDGFGCHPSSAGGTGNVFRGCRAWFNSDDGFDLINAFAAVTIDSCWSFYNGYSTTMVSEGDGNGFKAGGFGMDISPKVPTVIPSHIVEHSLAYYNKQSGFYSNHHLGGDEFYNNTAYKNNRNFNMVNRKSQGEAVDVPGYNHILKNNLSYSPRTVDADIVNLDVSSDSASINAFNSFSIPLSPSDADFNSVDASELTEPRKADGRLPDIQFMGLKSDKFVDEGTDVGLSFKGNAPDLGYMESDRASALPVDYIKPLSAKIINAKAVLSWTTAIEHNNNGFKIERSQNGLANWEEVGFIKSHFDLGNGSGFAYQFTDNQIDLNQINYYRLGQIDANGECHYSNIVELHLKNKDDMKSFSLYPNPVTGAKGKITMVFKDILEESSIGFIYDLNGRELQKFELLSGNKLYKVDISNLSGGVYFIKIANKKEILGQNKLLVNQY